MSPRKDKQALSPAEQAELEERRREKVNQAKARHREREAWKRNNPGKDDSEMPPHLQIQKRGRVRDPGLTPEEHALIDHKLETNRRSLARKAYEETWVGIPLPEDLERLPPGPARPKGLTPQQHHLLDIKANSRKRNALEKAGKEVPPELKRQHAWTRPSPKLEEPWTQGPSWDSRQPGPSPDSPEPDQPQGHSPYGHSGSGSGSSRPSFSAHSDNKVLQPFIPYGQPGVERGAQYQGNLEARLTQAHAEAKFKDLQRKKAREDADLGNDGYGGGR